MQRIAGNLCHQLGLTRAVTSAGTRAPARISTTTATAISRRRICQRQNASSGENLNGSENASTIGDLTVHCRNASSLCVSVFYLICKICCLVSAWT